MTHFLSWMSGMAVIVALSGTALGADVVSYGTVKDVRSEKKDFVLTDSAGKDWTIKLGDNVVINRDGKESKSDLKVGDKVNVCYDKGVLTWTAHYILVQEGASKNYELMHGTFKSYDEDKKAIVFTDADGKDHTFVAGTAKVRLNQEASKAKDLKVGEKALAIVEKADGKITLKSLMIERK
jgi:Cu/Ag efflux protein CusF